jgi:hypothetical protein
MVEAAFNKAVVSEINVSTFRQRIERVLRQPPRIERLRGGRQSGALCPTAMQSRR